MTTTIFNYNPLINIINLSNNHLSNEYSEVFRAYHSLLNKSFWRDGNARSSPY